MRVLEGTQSVSTLAPPMPSRSIDGDLRTELRGDQRGLVAGRSAADDDDAGHGSFPGAVRTVAGPFSPVPSGRAPPSSGRPRPLVSLGRDGPLRRLRVEHGPRADAAPLPVVPAHRHRAGSAAGGSPSAPRSTAGRARWPPSCPTSPSSCTRACSSRSTTSPRPTSGRSTPGRAPTPGSTGGCTCGCTRSAGDVVAYVYVLDAFEGGLPSARYLGALADAAEAAGAPTTTSPSSAPGSAARASDRHLRPGRSGGSAGWRGRG